MKDVFDYTDHVVQHQLVRGLYDQGIKEHMSASAATEEGTQID